MVSRVQYVCQMEKDKPAVGTIDGTLAAYIEHNTSTVQQAHTQENKDALNVLRRRYILGYLSQLTQSWPPCRATLQGPVWGECSPTLQGWPHSSTAMRVTRLPLVPTRLHPILCRHRCSSHPSRTTELFMHLSRAGRGADRSKVEKWQSCGLQQALHADAAPCSAGWGACGCTSCEGPDRGLACHFTATEAMALSPGVHRDRDGSCCPL